ncbi:Lysosome-associated membrane glycoprotein 1 [Saguinus oedipus]|uniref:CD107 antigen-like family member A n=1 Tax=Saguinus oedipus TaxID=9490 RepID=A0ABQ9WAN1_SAGOE|nr:Lysosome-associated membrane glycoprotein 1 [Saguinus oedipus]
MFETTQWLKIIFVFKNASSSRFFLQGIQLNTTLPDARGENPQSLEPRPPPGVSRSYFTCVCVADPTFKAANNSLRTLQATVGNSYKCNAEERVRVTTAFSVNIVKVWVQAFKVDGDQFGSGECRRGQLSWRVEDALQTPPVDI